MADNDNFISLLIEERKRLVYGVELIDKMLTLYQNNVFNSFTDNVGADSSYISKEEIRESILNFANMFDGQFTVKELHLHLIETGISIQRYNVLNMVKKMASNNELILEKPSKKRVLLRAI